MGERLKQLRKMFKLTQREFAEKIGIKQNTFAQYELGRNEPIDAVVSLICREFGVNEKWLRTGEGEMFVKKTEDEEAEYYRGRIDELFTGRDEKFRKALLDVVLRMDAQQVAAVKEYAVRYLLPAVEEGQAGEEPEDAAGPFADLAAASPDPEDQAAAATFASAAAASPDSEDQGAAATFASTAAVGTDPSFAPAAASPAFDREGQTEVKPRRAEADRAPAAKWQQTAAETGRTAAADTDPDEPVGLSGKDVVEIERMVSDYRAQLIAEKKAAAASAASHVHGSKKEA